MVYREQELRSGELLSPEILSIYMGGLFTSALWVPWARGKTLKRGCGFQTGTALEIWSTSGWSRLQTGSGNERDL